MVDKEQKSASKQKTATAPVKGAAAVKAEEAQPNTSGESGQPQTQSQAHAWRCFVTTTKGSKLLLFAQPTADVKQIMSDVAKRHNAQCKELGRIKCKFLALCQNTELEGFKLTNDMILQDLAASPPVYLTAYVEDSVPTVKRKASEDDDSAAKKAKSTPAANGASGNGTAASEAPKKRGRPSNKEKAEREAAAAAAQAGAADDKGKAPLQTQEAQAAANKGKGKAETAPAPVSQPAKPPTKPSVTKPAAPAKEEESSSEEDSDDDSDDDSSSDESQTPKVAKKDDADDDDSDSDEESSSEDDDE